MKKGFTLIELLIVIAVISILIGIALPRFRGMVEEGNIARAKGELRTLQTAVESYYIHNSNAYPPTGTTWENPLATATPNIIGAAPADPFNGTTQYGYAVDASPAKYYVIYSVGTAGTGAATVTTAGVVSEGATGASCIYVTNGSSKDSVP